MILVVGKHPAPRVLRRLVSLLMDEFTTATRAEPGNISYDWYRSAEIRSAEIRTFGYWSRSLETGKQAKPM